MVDEEDLTTVVIAAEEDVVVVVMVEETWPLEGIVKLETTPLLTLSDVSAAGSHWHTYWTVMASGMTVNLA